MSIFEKYRAFNVIFTPSIYIHVNGTKQQIIFIHAITALCFGFYSSFDNSVMFNARKMVYAALILHVSNLSSSILK